MDSYSQMLSMLRQMSAAERFAHLYGHREGEMARQLTRYSRLAKQHEELFNAGNKQLSFISASGRTEIAGNHTDHNHGCVLAAAVNLDTLACVSPRNDMTVHLHSEGFEPFEISLDDLSVVESEKGKTQSLIRGVADGMVNHGFKIGGFDAAVTSDVLSGSGLSSSAAFEVLTCAIFDALYNGFTVNSTLRAQIAQYAENVYFGKPSGLMDQMASSTGGLVTIDFKGEPVIEPLSFDFNAAGYSLVVVNAGSSHDNLTAEYASIREEMQSVSRYFGEEVLRDIRPEHIEMHLNELRLKFGERAVLRSMHFFEENKRVHTQVSALKKNDVRTMLQSVIESGESSWMLLQNLYPAGKNQPLALALKMASDMLKGKGAWRVHGGGFAGTTLNFVPNDAVDTFVERMERVFGQGSCYVLDVRPEGAAIVFSTAEQ